MCSVFSVFVFYCDNVLWFIVIMVLVIVFTVSGLFFSKFATISYHWRIPLNLWCLTFPFSVSVQLFLVPPLDFFLYCHFFFFLLTSSSMICFFFFSADILFTTAVIFLFFLFHLLCHFYFNWSIYQFSIVMFHMKCKKKQQTTEIIRSEKSARL